MLGNALLPIGFAVGGLESIMQGSEQPMEGVPSFMSLLLRFQQLLGAGPLTALPEEQQSRMLTSLTSQEEGGEPLVSPGGSLSLLALVAPTAAMYGAGEEAPLGEESGIPGVGVPFQVSALEGGLPLEAALPGADPTSQPVAESGLSAAPGLPGVLQALAAAVAAADPGAEKPPVGRNGWAFAAPEPRAAADAPRAAVPALASVVAHQKDDLSRLAEILAGRLKGGEITVDEKGVLRISGTALEIDVSREYPELKGLIAQLRGAKEGPPGPGLPAKARGGAVPSSGQPTPAGLQPQHSETPPVAETSELKALLHRQHGRFFGPSSTPAAAVAVVAPGPAVQAAPSSAPADLLEQAQEETGNAGEGSHHWEENPSAIPFDPAGEEAGQAHASASGRGPAEARSHGSAAPVLETSSSRAPFGAQLAQQITRLATVEVSEGRSKVRVALEPPSLGHLEVHVSVENGSITTHVIAENRMAKELIESHLDQLRQALQQSGLRLEKFSVEVGDQFVGHNPFDHEDQARQGRNSVPSDLGLWAQEKETGGVEPPAGRLPSSRSSIDIRI